MTQNKKMGACALALVSLAAFVAPSLANAADSGSPARALRRVVELPLEFGWYEGREVNYVTTDVSDAGMAVEKGANYVPRLANAIVPAAPGRPTAVERLYHFLNFKQGSVLPSVPEPVGPANRNRNYSPIWQVYAVAWNAGAAPRELRGEEEVLDAEEKGQVTLTKTNIVVNCPVVFFAGEGLLPGAVIKTVPATAQ